MKNNNCVTTLGKFQRGFVISSMVLMINSLMVPAEAAITINFNYTDPSGVGFNAAGSLGESRRAAIEQAGTLLTSYFPSYTATITFDVNGSVTEDGSLASATSNYNSADASSCVTGISGRGDVGLKVLGGVDPAPDIADGVINVNFEDHIWDLDDIIDSDKYDFKSTMLHEILHAFGFGASIRENGDDSCGQTAPKAGAWEPFDQYIGNTTNTFIDSNYVIDLASWLTAVTGGIGNSGLLWRGANAMAANNGYPIPLYSPSPYSSGSSVSHLDDDFYTDTLLLMEHAAETGQGTRTLSAIELGIFNDIGISGAASTASNSVRADNNGDGKADILWRNSDSGENVLWTMDGLSVIGNAGINMVANQAWQIAGRGDFDGDGKSDLLWRNNESGQNVIYLMDGAEIVDTQTLNVVNLSWEIKAVGDFDGDGKYDIFWRNTQGDTAIYLMNGTKITSSANVTRVANPNWEFIDTGDVNGDGKDDLVWRHKIDGVNVVWLMEGLKISDAYQLNTIPVNWLLVGLGDLNVDGTDDFIWSNQSDGRKHAYLMNRSGQIQDSLPIAVIDNLDWQIVDILDLNGDGKYDFFWRNEVSNEAAIWLMDGVDIQEDVLVDFEIGDVWKYIR